MTKAEAIAMLKRIQEPEAWEPQINQAAFEALDMAIEALEPKPYEKFESAKDHIYKLAGDYKCWDNRLTKDEAVELCHILEQQPCEDTISRQAAIDALDEIEAEVADGYGYQYAKWREYFVEMPSAQPERKRGEWILAEDGWYCSVCELYPPFDCDPEEKGIPYCPNCGADMRGEQNE